MSTLDTLYQRAVDEEVANLRALPPEAIRDLAPSGQKTVTVDARPITISWWKNQVPPDTCHVVCSSERRAFFFFQKVYANGVKIQDGQVAYLSGEELAGYY
jgi:hypothetical protein